jgi:hypothetical protein
MEEFIDIYRELNTISSLTDRLRYSFEPYSITGLRGTRGLDPDVEPDYRELSLEEIDDIEHDIRKIKTYIESDMTVFIKDTVETIDKASERLLCQYGITRDNAHEFKDRIDIDMFYGPEYTRRRYFLDGKYIGTVRSHVDTDFEDLHAEFVVEIIHEDKER